jgi:hypothetical protein
MSDNNNNLLSESIDRDIEESEAAPIPKSNNANNNSSRFSNNNSNGLDHRNSVSISKISLSDYNKQLYFKNYGCCGCSLPTTLKGLRRMGFASLCFGVLGLILLTIAIGAPILFKQLINDGLRQASIINSIDSNGYNNWISNSDNPLLVKIYLYDYVNPSDILNGSKPIIIERGPYVFNEYRVHYNVSWFNNGNIIQYRTWQYYKFIPELSCEPTLSRDITSLNIVFQGIQSGILSSTSPQAQFEKLILEALYKNVADLDKYFIFKNVSQVLFGFVDPQLINAHKSMPDVFVTNYNPQFFPNFTLEQLVNDTTGETESNKKWNILYTGQNNQQQIRTFIQWHNHTNNDFWGNETAFQNDFNW